MWKVASNAAQRRNCCQAFWLRGEESSRWSRSARDGRGLAHSGYSLEGRSGPALRCERKMADGFCSCGRRPLLGGHRGRLGRTEPTGGGGGIMSSERGVAVKRVEEEIGCGNGSSEWREHNSGTW